MRITPAICLLALLACNRKQVPAPAASTTAIVSIGGPDYSDPRNWAALPQMKDPSDSLPQGLRAAYSADTSVDVFFIHPTTYTYKEAVEWNAPLDDENLNRKTDRGSILYQASIFNRYNVYAPRYRQAHVRAYFSTDTVVAKNALDMAYSDVKKAFLYYLHNKNNGKPIILAAHSQGTTHAKKLLAELFDGKALQQQLVAAYLVGIPVEPGYFKSIPVCSDSSQTGCFMSWRTFRRDFEPDYQPAYRQSIVVNPLSWKADTAYIKASANKGAVLRDFSKLIPHVNDAQVHEDLLWISRPKFRGSRFYKSQNYHIGDYNLFYLNIRENLDQRVRAFKAKQPS